MRQIRDNPPYWIVEDIDGHDFKTVEGRKLICSKCGLDCLTTSDPNITYYFRGDNYSCEEFKLLNLIA